MDRLMQSEGYLAEGMSAHHSFIRMTRDDSTYSGIYSNELVPCDPCTIGFNYLAVSGVNVLPKLWPTLVQADYVLHHFDARFALNVLLVRFAVFIDEIINLESVDDF